MAFVGAIVGRRKTGKTMLLAELLKTVYQGRFTCIFVFSRTWYIQTEIWDEICGNILVIPDLSMPVIKDIMAYQDKDKGEVLVILDDVGLTAKQFAKTGRFQSQEDLVSDICFSGRHRNISIIYLAQTYTMIPSPYRGQMDFMLVLALKKLDQRMVYYELASDIFSDIVLFRKYNVACTGSYRFYMLYNDNGIYKVFPEFCVKKKRVKQDTQEDKTEESKNTIGYTGQNLQKKEPGTI